MLRLLSRGSGETRIYSISGECCSPTERIARSRNSAWLNEMVTIETMCISVCTFLSLRVQGKQDNRVYEVRSREPFSCSIGRKQHVPYKQNSNERKQRKQRFSARGADQRAGSKPQNPGPEHR